MTVFAPVEPVENISAEWLTHALTGAGRLSGGAKVVSAQYEPCGTGQLGETYRFRLTYAPAGVGPETYVIKFPSKDATSREYGGSMGYYRNEIFFYQRIAPRLDMALATPVYAAIADNNTDFVLVMDDLAPARAVDQLIGCTADETALVMEQAAAFHAASWRDSDLAGQSWLDMPSRIFTRATDTFGDVLKKFPELCADLVPDEDLQEAAKLVPLADAWKRVFHEPQCLWHTDIRADNTLFEAAGGKFPAVILDWQGLGYGRGSIDVALFLGCSVTPEVRRQHERQLIAHYHDALVKRGVSDYSAEQCWNDYRVNAIISLQIGCYGLGAVKRTERGDRMWKSWIERGAAQVRDLDSFEALAAL